MLWAGGGYPVCLPEACLSPGGVGRKGVCIYGGSMLAAGWSMKRGVWCLTWRDIQVWESLMMMMMDLMGVWRCRVGSLRL